MVTIFPPSVTIWMMPRSTVTQGRCRRLNLAQQALELRRLFPTTQPTIRRSQLVWVAVLTPTPLSRAYTIRVTYSVGEYPKVVVVDPPLDPDPNGYLPHFYSGDGCLCLHEADDWDSSLLIAGTILPWATEWLAHYELWKQTGQWYGNLDPSEEGSVRRPAGRFRRTPERCSTWPR
jgi:hypothetical protein